MATKSGTLTTNKITPKREPETEPDVPVSLIAKSASEAVNLSLLQVSDLIQNRLGRALREFDLTLSQYQVLRILEHAGVTLPSLEIAKRMPQVVPAITGLLTRLDQQGYIKRKPDKDDKRVTQVELTAKARALLKKIEKPVLDLHRDLSKALNEVEAKQLSKLLEKISPGPQTPN